MATSYLMGKQKLKSSLTYMQTVHERSAKQLPHCLSMRTHDHTTSSQSWIEVYRGAWSYSNEWTARVWMPECYLSIIETLVSRVPSVWLSSWRHALCHNDSSSDLSSFTPHWVGETYDISYLSFMFWSKYCICYRELPFDPHQSYCAGPAGVL